MTDRSVHHATIVIDRDFEASPSRVYACWADPALRALWDFPGEGWEATQIESDFRVGGRKVSRFGPPGGPQYTEDMRYEDIVEGRRIVFAYTITREAERITSSLTTAEFAPDGARTRLKLTEQIAILDGGDTTKDREAGWNEALDKLAAELDRQAQPA